MRDGAEQRHTALATRVRVLGALLGSALTMACTQTTEPQTARLLGTHAMALVDRYLFIASTDRDELRVLDMAPPGAVGRRFVRAPNPIEVLSVPVLARPTLVTAEQWYRADGARETGHYVFVSREGAREFSVVDATRPTGEAAAEASARDLRFRELRRVALSGPLTALAATRPEAAQTVLYVAVYDGSAGALLAVELPSAAAALAALDDDALQRRFRRVAEVRGEPIVAVAPVPGLAGRRAEGAPFCAGTEICLALATRARQGQSGRALLLEPSSARTVPLRFPGPVRGLASAGRFEVLESVAPRSVAAGERIFGVLDEEACGSPSCGGVVAVDTLEAGPEGFALALDFVGTPMLPLRAGAGLVTGLHLEPSGRLRLPSSMNVDPQTGAAAEGVRQLPLLGVTSSSSGELHFFDGARLKVLDTDLAPAAVASSKLIDASGVEREWLDGPVRGEVRVLDGAWQSQWVVGVWEGAIPGLVDLPLQSPRALRTDASSGATARCAVGDVVVLSTESGVCGEATVVATTAETVEFDGPPRGCEGATRGTVRATGGAPLVVVAESLGYLGRVAPGSELVVRRTDAAFAHLPGFDPAAPLLRLPVGAAGGAARDWSWRMYVDAHFSPYVAALSTDPLYGPCAASAVLPSTLAYDSVRHLLFVAYPSANLVAELELESTLPGLIRQSQRARCHQ